MLRQLLDEVPRMQKTTLEMPGCTNELCVFQTEITPPFGPYTVIVASPVIPTLWSCVRSGCWLVMFAKTVEPKRKAIATLPTIRREIFVLEAVSKD